MTAWDVETRDLGKRYGDREAVRGLNLRIPRGCCFGFVGPNGAGKTTTMSMLTGLLLPTTGSVWIGGQPVLPNSADIRRRVGVVPDQPRMFERLCLDETLGLLGSIYGLDPVVAAERSEELLRLLQLDDARTKPLAEYSHGMKKRAAFAMAVIHDPAVMFLDEPFEGMDPVGVRLLMANLGHMTRLGRTVFVTSHALDLVERLCSRIAIINSGAIAWEGGSGEVRSQATPAASAAPAVSGLETLFHQVTGSQDDVPVLSWLQ